MSISRLSLALVALLAPFAAHAEDSAVPAKAAACVSCHSADGNPLVAGVPILAGQRADYMAMALRAYREGRRTGGPAGVMAFYVKDMSDQDIEEIVQWFAEH
ncbi:c-type cytochrome [Hoeflea ulvae]|uniref:C-type cytochrome n=1 Tax=Hoeflea ulvae TaxID=2983764 RepID=A0ABT3YLT6_9HYPH|nr:c-type cytochrome [Hoeflea ulvae]MCY0096865.1 c-type cytochrome [Hoeflea ulvae]